MGADLACTNFSQKNYRKIQTLYLKPGSLSLCPELVPPKLTAAYGHSAWRDCSVFFQPQEKLIRFLYKYGVRCDQRDIRMWRGMRAFQGRRARRVVRLSGGVAPGYLTRALSGRVVGAVTHQVG